MSESKPEIDVERVAEWLQILVEPDSTVEMRVLNENGALVVRHYKSSDLTGMANDAALLGRKAKGVYWLMNALPADWRGTTAKDADISKRRWLLVDCDPRRTGDSSATEEEKELARKKMVEVDSFLAESGWPAPVIADSGNGFHLLYRIDLPGKDDGLVTGVLRALARMFNDGNVSIDTKVGNASRICKLYGTVSRKGVQTENRPHRQSNILTVPEEFCVVSSELMNNLIRDLAESCRSTDARTITRLLEQPTESPSPENKEWARNYLKQMPASISGQGGHDSLIRAASVIVNDFGLNDADAFDLLATEFNPCCDPPWSDSEIQRKVQECKKNPPIRPPKGLNMRYGNASNHRDNPEGFTDITDIIEAPEHIAEAAMHGVVGKIVRKIEPHSEADPVAILMHLLVAMGNIIGRKSYFEVESTLHFANLFTVVVGRSSSSKKGTAGEHVLRIVRQVDANWWQNCILQGLVSGEGLIWQVRDPMTNDPGVNDKRLLGFESEFSALLKAKAREKNTLSEILRQAWDSGRLRTAAKNTPAKATDAHVSLIGHITPFELQSISAEVDMMNGLANRFLWCCVKRSKLLPDGGDIHKVSFDAELHTLREAIEFAGIEQRIIRDERASAEWHRIYPDLTRERLGAAGAVCNRGAAQVVRLSLLYALLDRSTVITLEHLQAALAVWNYCEASAKCIFGGKFGDKMLDKIFQALREASPDGLSKTDISGLFRRNKSQDDIDRALRWLFTQRLARRKFVPTQGRDAEMWYMAS